MKNNYIIRQAKVEDITEIAGLYRALMKYIHHKYDATINVSSLATKHAVKLFKQGLGRPNEYLKVATLKDKIVGFEWGFITTTPWYRQPMKIAEATAMYILPAYRSQGIGQALFLDLVRWADQRGATRIRGVTDTANVRARKLYRRLGWNEPSVNLEADTKALLRRNIKFSRNGHRV